ncbi:MAG: DUF1292 domain-containing protein [Oscillospiraceae bacterium]|nr:DUF1292 domain-containing protein [Oscillospiraceae bacterium]
MSSEIENNEIENGDADLITLVDEEGVEHEFEVIDTVEVDGVEYVALVPVFDDPEDALEDSGELIILRVDEEDGEEVLEAVEDDAEFDKVGAIFKERLKDTFDFEDEEE